MLDYPLARLQGALDAGATLTVSSDGHTLSATLRSANGSTEITADGPDLASVASALISMWFAYNQIAPPADNGEGPLRPHMRAALAEFGAQQGSARADGYGTPGCDCDYCSAYHVAFQAADDAAEGDDAAPDVAETERPPARW